MLQPGRFVGQHVTAGSHADYPNFDDKYVIGSVLQRQQLGDRAAAEVPEYRGLDHNGVGHRGHTHRDQLRSKLKLVDAKLSALSLSAGGAIGIQWVMFLTGCPEKKSIQCGWGLSSTKMPRVAFPSANSRTSSPALGVATHIGRQQNWLAPKNHSSTDICVSPARTLNGWVWKHDELGLNFGFQMTNYAGNFRCPRRTA
jgi:hypothetical protein